MSLANKQIGFFYQDNRSDRALKGKWRLFNVRPSDTPHFIIAFRADGEQVRVFEQDIRIETVSDNIHPFTELQIKEKEKSNDNAASTSSPS